MVGIFHPPFKVTLYFLTLLLGNEIKNERTRTRTRNTSDTVRNEIKSYGHLEKKKEREKGEAS